MSRIDWKSVPAGWGNDGLAKLFRAAPVRRRQGWWPMRRTPEPVSLANTLVQQGLRYLPVVMGALSNRAGRVDAAARTAVSREKDRWTTPAAPSLPSRKSSIGLAALGALPAVLAGVGAYAASETFRRQMAVRAGQQPVQARAAPAPVEPTLPAHSSAQRRADHRPGVRDARAAEPGRGRNAEAPHHIPWAGWKDILWRVYADINDNRLLAVAAGVTFYGILAIFPAIAATVSLYGLFTNPASINDNLSGFLSVMPSGGVEIISDEVKRVASQPGGALSFGLILGLGISLWSANAGMKAVFDALNIVYEENEKRSFVMLNLQSLACTMGALVAVLIAVAVIVISPIVFAFVGIDHWATIVIAWLRWPLMLAVVLSAFAVLYRVGPSRKYAQWRWLSVGSVVAAIGWMIVSIGFSWYVSNFGSYNKTYGSLGAAIGFMTWIWLSTFVVLLGAEINAEMEHQTAEDTTVGSKKPMGQRRAEMADTVGKAS